MIRDDHRVVTILYTNHRGETAERRIIPRRLRFGSSPWHPDEQWLLDAVDVEKDQRRTFAMKDVQRWGSTGKPKERER
jgi:hypothetical protein